MWRWHLCSARSPVGGAALHAPVEVQAAQSGEERIRAEPSFEVVQGRQEWGVLALRREDGSVTLLLRNRDPDRSGEDLRVELVVDGFEVDEWRAEEVGIAAGGTVGELSGTGVTRRGAADQPRRAADARVRVMGEGSREWKVVVIEFIDLVR